jgi:hypothetical protein
MGSDDEQVHPQPDLSAAVFVDAIAGRQSFPGIKRSLESEKRVSRIFQAAMWKSEEGTERPAGGQGQGVEDARQPTQSPMSTTADAFTSQQPVRPAVDEAIAPQYAHSQQPAPASAADELAKLAQLRDRAVISADEFETFKNKLLEY